MEKKRFPFSQNSILALFMVIVLFVFAGFSFDFYYDLNDDVLIKDILSGVYTGMPDAHNIQMLYPLSLIISLLYRMIPGLAWHGIFLCVCHGVCFYLIAKRSISFVENTWAKVGLLVTESAIVLTLFMWELVVVQYTITSALLAACACFLVFTSEKRDSLPLFLKAQWVPVLLVVLAFNIRSEMLLLMSPFIAFTGIIKWSEEKQVFHKETIQKYVGLIAVIVFGLGASLLVDFIAYSGSEWKEFRDFFNARTKVYDYTWYPSYEEAKEFYQGMGATSAQIALIDNYNFGMDESIDAEFLWDIASYAEENNVKIPLIERIKTAIVEYEWRTFHEQDAPYNYFVIAAYAMVVLLALIHGDITAGWKLPFMMVFRTIPWMYVILAKRVPPRISHPLYYIELVILCAWMLTYCGRMNETDGEQEGRYNNEKVCRVVLIGCVLAFLLLSLVKLPGMWRKTLVEMERRETVNSLMQEFDIYAKEHPQNYYYMDVYSTVAFSEKMFERVDNNQKNYDILGGWLSGSPLQRQATVGYHNDKLSRAELLLQDNFFFVCEEDADIAFLEEFYGTQGITIALQETDRIQAIDNAFLVYQIHVIGTALD